MEIKNCFIRPYGEYAIKIKNLKEKNIVENNYLCGNPSFFKHPLLWIALKVIDHEYKKYYGEINIVEALVKYYDKV